MKKRMSLAFRSLPNHLEVVAEAYSYVFVFHSCFSLQFDFDAIYNSCVYVCVRMRQYFKCNLSGSTVIVLTHLMRMFAKPLLKSLFAKKKNDSNLSLATIE